MSAAPPPRAEGGGRAVDGADGRGGAPKERQQSMWYFTKEQIEKSPSYAYFLKKNGNNDKAALEKELSYRRLTCAFLQESGQKLRLPQLSIATAIVFFHRFYARESYEHYDRFTVATTCLFLASKVEETPKKLKDVVVETFKVHHNTDKAPEPETKDHFELKEKILVCERILLQTLCFDLSVEHAYRPLLAYVKSIKGTRDLAQIAWNFINDSLRTTICLQHPPRYLAAAAAHLAAKYLATQNKKQFDLPSLPTGEKWYMAFQASEDIITDISNQILEMYADKPGQPATQNNALSAASLSLMTQSRGESLQKAGTSSDAAAPASATVPASPAPSATPAAASVPPSVPSVPPSLALPAPTGVKVEGASAAPTDPAVKSEPAAPSPAATAVPTDKSDPALPTEPKAEISAPPTDQPSASVKRQASAVEDGEIEEPDGKRSRPL